MQFAAILVAAGSGERAGAGQPKVWRLLGGKPVARWSAEALLAAGAKPLVVVVAADCGAVARQALDGLGAIFVTGGATRAASVRAGLDAVSHAEAPDAVLAWRTAIGATDPAEAAEGTIRKLFAESKGKNAVHGSDSDENAAREIAFFFPERELALLGVV